MKMIVEEIDYERRLKFGRERAAQAWCTEETRNIEMDTKLAEAFAQILADEMYQPRLGCATTGEIIEELKARSNLNYRTIDGDDDENYTHCDCSHI